MCIKAVNRHVIFLGKQQFQIGVVYLNTPGNEKEMLQCDGVTEKVQQTMAEFSPKHCGIAQIDIEKVFLQDYLGLIGTQKNFRGSCQLAGAGFIHAGQDGDGKTAGIPLFSGSR